MKWATGAVLAVMISGGAFAQTTGDVAQIEFNPVDLTDSDGAKLGSAVLTYRDQTYPVRVNGLGIGGGTDVVVTVTGEVQGFADVAELEDLFYADPGLTPGADSGNEDLWLHSAGGVSIRLASDHPEVVVAPGGEAVSLHFGWVE